MNYLKREHIIASLLGGSVLLVILVLFLSFGNYSKEETDLEEWMAFEEGTQEEEMEAEVEPFEVNSMIVIDIKGAVHNPGVYEMPEESRLFEVIDKAGGFSDTAADGQINLASIVEDEMMVYVPEMGEEMVEPVMSQSQKEDGKVLINQASASELQALPGVGPAKAVAIIAHREEHGEFKQEEDLLQVSGIGEKSFEQMKELIQIK